MTPNSNIVIFQIDSYRQELERIYRQFHVRQLEIFGSATMKEFDPQSSDLDFLVEFGDVPANERFDTYFALKTALAQLFNRSVDLVESKAMRNPYFIQRVNESRRLVYAA